ncbi:MAG: NUDIX domain-containing protein [Acidimicrobiia bacterium]|nr:NUDIX domain-containing protein [Acidimicrobiia bacterium]
MPIRPAATVMLVADLPELHVLMLRRAARQVFAPDMWVYPGGAVDPADAEDAAPHVHGLDDEEASRRLGLVSGGLAFWVAAVRECFEEAGVLFAHGGLDHLDHLDAERLGRRRAALNRHEEDFVALLAEEGLRLDLGALHPVAHWVTPLGSPRRFDTRFFLAAFPAGQEAAHDDGEAVHSAWVRPAEAVAAWRRDELSMMSPTVRMLMCLEHFTSAAEAVAAAAAGLEPHQVRVRRREGVYEILLPGDASYETGEDESEFGWVALRRLEP